MTTKSKNEIVINMAEEVQFTTEKDYIRLNKSSTEDIEFLEVKLKILNEKELNGKDIGDGHILNAEPGKRNPSIITINIEITYSSEDELASDALKENVRSYFEKFSELFDLNK